MDELLIEGFTYHGPGGCPKCGGTLVVVDSEMSLMRLNKDGIPTKIESTEVRCVAACERCGHKVPMARWKGGYVPCTGAAMIILEGEAKYEAEQRVLQMNKLGKETNPLAIG